MSSYVYGLYGQRGEALGYANLQRERSLSRIFISVRSRGLSWTGGAEGDESAME